MTNRISIACAILIIAFLVFDHMNYQSEMAIFLARKLIDLAEYLAFWR